MTFIDKVKNFFGKKDQGGSDSANYPSHTTTRVVPGFFSSGRHYGGTETYHVTYPDLVLPNAKNPDNKNAIKESASITEAKTNADESPLITMRQAAKFIGVNEQTVYAWICSEKYQAYLSFRRDGEKQNSPWKVPLHEVVHFKKKIYKPYLRLPREK